MRVAIRTDANSVVGTGHLHRCLNIARELVVRGHEVAFLLGHNSSLHEVNRFGDLFTVQQVNECVESFTVGGSDAVTPHHEIAQDAKSTIGHLATDSFDWVIVDHYSLNDTWVEAVKAKIDCGVLAIDDLGRNWKMPDVLLDSALEAGGSYESVPTTCSTLFGPSYVPLNPMYKTAQNVPEQENRGVVTIFFGGADGPNATASTLRALSAVTRKDLSIRVVVGDLNPNNDALRREYASSGVSFLDPADSLCEHLQVSDAFLGGGGTTTWERLCLGVPSATISIAENQVKMSKGLADAGCLIYLGDIAQVTAGAVQFTINRLLNDRELRDDMSLRGRLLVDGFGSSRVSEVIQPSSPKKIALRPARESDSLTLFRWVNDPDVRRASLASELISWTTHTNWYKKFLNHPGKHLFIAELNGLPVGQIRFEPVDDRLRLSYAVDSLFRGKGIGREIVAVGIRELRRIAPNPILAEVRAENEASLRVFRALGFEERDLSARGVYTFLLH